MSYFNIHSEPLSFVRFLLGTIFAEPDVIGYDPTIWISPNGSMSVTVKNMYTIMETLYFTGMLRGRATICWHGERNGREYAIKDSWPDSSRTISETWFLEVAAENGIVGVPMVEECIDLAVNGVKDMTDSRWAMFSRDAGGAAGKKVRKWLGKGAGTIGNGVKHGKDNQRSKIKWTRYFSNSKTESIEGLCSPPSLCRWLTSHQNGNYCLSRV